MIKKMIAKEWLVLVTMMVIGIIWQAYVDKAGHDTIVLFIPYIVVQFLRSVIWAIRTLLKKEKNG